MANPLSQTFLVLGRTANKHALAVLTAGLEVEVEEVRQRAVEAILRRRSPDGQLEIIRRYDSFTPDLRRRVERRAEDLSAGLSRALLQNEPRLRETALRIIGASQESRLIPLLIDMLEDDRPEVQQAGADMIRDWVDGIDRGRPSPSSARRLAELRHNMLRQLNRACARVTALGRPDVVIESMLVLGSAESEILGKLLAHPDSETAQLVQHVVLTSRHPAVMQRMVDFLSQPSPPAVVLETLRARTDRDFLSSLLRGLPDRLSPIQESNLRQIRSLDWVEPSGAGLRQIPPELHGALPRFILATGLPVEQKRFVQRWLLNQGSAAGRRAAVEEMDLLDFSTVRDLIFRGLDSEDPEVQAWATSQLRQQEIPEAFSLLLQRLDSPKSAVREAARAELGGFNLEMMLRLSEHLDPETCRRAAAVIRKTDPDCVGKLLKEMAAPLARMRIRAARTALALDLQTEVVPGLLSLAEDADAFVRQAAAEVLGHVPLPEVVEALKQLYHDGSPRVRDEARRSLDHLREVIQREAAAH